MTQVSITFLVHKTFFTECEVVHFNFLDNVFLTCLINVRPMKYWETQKTVFSRLIEKNI